MKKLLIITYLLFHYLVTKAQVTYTSQNIEFISDLVSYADPRLNIWSQPTKHKEYVIYGNNSSIKFADISDPKHPKIVDSIAELFITSSFQKIDVQKNLCYILNSWGGMDVYNLQSLPDSVSYVGTIDLFSFPLSNSYFSGENLYKNFGSNIGVINFSDFFNPVLTDSLVTDIPNLGNCLLLNVYNDTLYTSYGPKGVYIFAFINHKFSIIDSIPHNFPSLVSNYSNCVSANKKTLCAFYKPTTLNAKFYSKNSNRKYEFAGEYQLMPSTNTVIPKFINNDWLAASNYQDGLYIYDVSDLKNIKKTGSFNCKKNALSQYNSGVADYLFGLPSGLLIVRQLNGGLFILDPKKAMPYKAPEIIEAQLNYNLSVYPNPCNEGFSIQLKRDFSSKLNLYDLQGITMYQKEYSSDIADYISTKELEEGNYILKIDGNEGQLTQKIIVRH